MSAESDVNASAIRELAEGIARDTQTTRQYIEQLETRLSESEGRNRRLENRMLLVVGAFETMGAVAHELREESRDAQHQRRLADHIVTELKRTCQAFPSQWDATDVSGNYWYLRYRGGVLSVDGPFVDKTAWERGANRRAAKSLLRPLGERNDGSMTDEQLRVALNDLAREQIVCTLAGVHLDRTVDPPSVVL